MATPFFVQTNTMYLSGSGVIVAATSVSVTSFTDIYGNVLTMADFGTRGYGTLEPDTTNEEAFSFTGITANANGTYTLTGIKTALAKSPYTETSGLIRAHSGGTKIVISDPAVFWGNLKAYVDAAVISGGVPATTVLLGLTTMSVAPAVAGTPIAVGDNDTRMFTAAQVTQVTQATVAGIVSPYAGSAAPAGWLLCDGTSYLRTTYANLFTAIGTLWGTVDGTHFNVPDLRGRSVVGSGTGTKVGTITAVAANVATLTGLTNAANNEFQTGQAVVFGATVAGNLVNASAPANVMPMVSSEVATGL